MVQIGDVENSMGFQDGQGIIVSTVPLNGVALVFGCTHKRRQVIDAHGQFAGAQVLAQFL